MNSKQMVVTCAIIQKDGLYLLTQRPSDKHNGDRREFPGGKVEFGEDPRDCLKREIQEELGIEIYVGKLVGYSSQVYGESKHVLLLGFLCEHVDGEIQFYDIQDAHWMSSQQMRDYDITEADIPFLELLN